MKMFCLSAVSIGVRISLATLLTVSASYVYAEDETVHQLPTITVQAEQDNKTYTEKSTASATKLNLVLKDTPQSVTIFTKQQMEDQLLTSASDVLMNTAGVTAIQYGQEGAGYSTYYSRGFEIKNILRDGIPSSYAAFGGKDMMGLEDTAIYERIEVLKGSTGLTSGSGYPSASIIYVRKRPTEELTGSIKVLGGTWDNYRSQVDVSGGLNADDSVRGRSVALYEQGGSQQDRYHRQNAVFYGALDVDLTDKTTLTSAITLQQVQLDDATAHGFPFITNDTPIQLQDYFDREDNAATDYAYSNTDKVNVLLGLEHEFNDNWQAVANYNYTKAKNDRVYAVAGSSAIVFEDTYTNARAGYTLQPGQMVVTSGRFTSTPEVHSLDIYTSGKFQALGREHDVMFGINGYSVASDDPSYGRYFTVVDIDGWNGHSEQPTILETGRTVVDEYQLGAFASTKLQVLDPLKLILGARFSNWERKVTDAEQKENGVFTPYAGLVFDITDQLSAYASYTSIFNPSSNKDANDDYLDPEEGNSVEGGFKFEIYDGRLNASAAYFQMQQDNLGVDTGADQADGTSIYKSIDGAGVKGYELSLAGEILPKWNIQAGYTHTDAKDANGDVLNTYIPEDTFKLFTSYQWDKLTIGGGVNWQSEFYLDGVTGIEAEAGRQDDYYLVNLMAKYDIQPDLSLGVNVKNLTDEKYKLNVRNGWGAGRSITGSLTYKF